MTNDPASMPESANYPEGYGRCVMCGADRNEACTVISGSGVPGDQIGDRRAHPHGGRAPIGDPLEPLEGFVPVADEPSVRLRGEATDAGRHVPFGVDDSNDIAEFYRGEDELREREHGDSADA